MTDATLLVAPLFPGKLLDDTWSARCEDLKLAVDRLYSRILTLHGKPQPRHSSTVNRQAPSKNQAIKDVIARAIT